jgi:Ca2+-binding EF-hand superfamily protein
VTFVEFCSFLRSLEVPMGGGDARRIFTLFDKDGNDEITYHEL